MVKTALFHTFRLILILALVIPLIVSTGKAQSQDPEGDRPSMGLIRGANFESLMLLEGGIQNSQPTQAGPLAVSSLITPSRLVFSSYRDGNFEIYNGNDDLSDLKRLTKNSAADVQPRINRSFTKIAFATNRNGNYDIYSMNLDGSGQTRLTNNSKDDVNPVWSPDGTKIAFEAYRDGHAEVYVMSADGIGQTRLTISASFDGEPAWSPDGTQIAFTAYRDGQWRIWVMQANGSGQTQLSQEPYSCKAAWSRDGKTIAYSADGNGDGWNELWKMNADGSGRVVDSYAGASGWNVAPQSWSPDQSWIAVCWTEWIVSNGNWYWDAAELSYIKPSFGPGEFVNLPGYTEWDPDWESPDIIAPVTSMPPLPSQSPGPFTVNWTGSDQGGTGFQFDVQVRDGSGGTWTDWISTTANSASYPGVGGHTYFFRSRGRDNAYNLEPWPADFEAFTTVEALPPVTHLNRLPDYSNTSLQSLVISWYGSDPGASGIHHFDVQYKISPAGNWTDWMMGTTATSGLFSIGSGNAVAFRVRATDNAFNQEAWHSSSGDTSTTTYNFDLSGSVMDNTGVPVAGAATTSDVPPLLNPNSQADGSFITLVNTSHTSVTSNWQKSGYGTLPATLFSAPGEERVNPVLPPADNVISDPGLEAASDPASAWKTGGVVGSAPSPNFHTGASSVMLGQPLALEMADIPGASGYHTTLVEPGGGIDIIFQGDYPLSAIRKENGGSWSDPIQLSGEPTWAEVGPWDATIAKDGTVHVVWFLWGNLYHRSRTPTGGWSASESFYPLPSFQCKDLHIVIDSSGNLHVVWSEGTSLKYVRRSSSGAWSTVENIFDITDIWGSDLIRVDGTGVLHFVYNMGNVLYYRSRNLAGTWSTPLTIAPQPLPWGASAKWDLQTDSAGNAYLVWDQYNDKNAGSTADIYYAKRGVDGTWSIPVNITKTPKNSTSPKIVLARDGSRHVIWIEATPDKDNEIFYSTQSGSGSWSNPEDVSNSTWPSGNAALVVDAQGNPLVEWVESVTTSSESYDEIAYAMKSGKWISTTYRSYPRDYGINIYFDHDGFVHLQWTNYGSGAVEDGTIQQAPAAGDAYLEQTVTLPAQMTTAVLSFNYQAVLLAKAAGTTFTAEVQESSTITPLLSTDTATPGWVHAWFDLSPWAGKKITVRFKVHLAEGKETGLVYVDDVTIGSALPDVWVTVLTPGSTLPGSVLHQTLHYGNRGFAPAEGVTIMVTLPDKLAFVSANPAPDNVAGQVLTWNAGPLTGSRGPFTIQLTTTVSADAALLSSLDGSAQILTASSELETVNNLAQTHTFIGVKTFIPMISK